MLKSGHIDTASHKIPTSAFYPFFFFFFIITFCHKQQQAYLEPASPNAIGPSTLLHCAYVAEDLADFSISPGGDKDQAVREASPLTTWLQTDGGLGDSQPASELIILDNAILSQISCMNNWFNSSSLCFDNTAQCDQHAAHSNINIFAEKSNLIESFLSFYSNSVGFCALNVTGI